MDGGFRSVHATLHERLQTALERMAPLALPAGFEIMPLRCRRPSVSR